MKNNPWRRTLALAAVAVALVGCASAPPKPYDYTAYRAADPKSILVLPPLNQSPDVKASNSVWAQAVFPLAESGYYVMPLSLVAETFRENGLSNPPEAHEANPAKLREFFGADAALYLNVKQYGTSYKVIASDTTVELEARLMDLRSGALLWEGSARASSAEQQQQAQGGLAGLLIQALVKQIVESATDAGHPIAGVASQRLLAAGRPTGMLFGPRSPLHGKEAQPPR